MVLLLLIVCAGVINGNPVYANDTTLILQHSTIEYSVPTSQSAIFQSGTVEYSVSPSRPSVFQSATVEYSVPVSRSAVVQSIGFEYSSPYSRSMVLTNASFEFTVPVHEDSAAIYSPAQDSVVAGILPLIGCADKRSFLYYTIAIGIGDTPTAYQEIFRGATRVLNDTLTLWNSSSFPDGYAWIRLTVVGETMGLRTEISVYRRVIINNQPPGITILCQPNPVGIGQETITITVDELLAQAPLVGLTLSSGETISVLAIQQTPNTFIAIYPVTTASPNGVVLVTVSATDLAGSIGTETADFYIDTIPPVIVITPVMSPTNQPVVLSYTVSDNYSPPERITVLGNNSPYTTLGDYTIILTAIDEAGNSETASVSFSIQRFYPWNIRSVISSSGFTDWADAGHFVICDGQPTPIGVSRSNQYYNSAGFLYAIYSAMPQPSLAPKNIRVNGYPCNGVVLGDQTPTITWFYPGGANNIQVGYELQLARDPGFSMVAAFGAGDTETGYTAPTLAESLYYVRIRIKNSTGLWSQWTDGSDSFIVRLPKYHLTSSVITSSGFTDYAQFGYPIFCDGQASPIGISSNGLDTNWAGWLYTLPRHGNWPPAPPDQIQVNGKLCDGVFINDQSPDISWHYVSTAGDVQTAFRINIARDQSFSTLVTDAEVVSPSAQYQPTCISEGPYFVRLKVRNNLNQWSDWTSGTDSYVLDITPPFTNKTVCPPAEQFASDTWLVFPETELFFSASDTLSGVLETQVRIDQGPWFALANPILQLTGLDSGLHLVTYRSLDRTGNIEAEHYEWDYLDTALLRLQVNPPTPGTINSRMNQQEIPLVTTTLGYEISRPCTMTITASDDVETVTLVDTFIGTRGVHKVLWDGRNMASPPTSLQNGVCYIRYQASVPEMTVTAETIVTLVAGAAKAAISGVSSLPNTVMLDADSSVAINFTLHIWRPSGDTQPMDSTIIRFYDYDDSLVAIVELSNLDASLAGISHTYLSPVSVFPTAGLYSYTIDAQYKEGHGHRTANTMRGAILAVDGQMTATSFDSITIWHDVNDSVAIASDQLGYQIVSTGGVYQGARYHISSASPLTRPALVDFGYSPQLFAGKLGLKRFNGVEWLDIATVEDEQNNRLLGRVTGFSTICIFAKVLEDMSQPEIVEASLDRRIISAVAQGSECVLSYRMRDDFSRYMPQTTVWVIDADGDRVATLDHQECRGLIARTYWGGCDDSGLPSPEGVYRFVLTVTDHSGKTACQQAGEVIIDNTPPSLTVISPASPTRQDVVLQYSATDNISEPSSIAITGDESPYRTAGVHVVVLIACDEAGNSSSETVVFCIDRTAPQIVDLSASPAVFSPDGNGVDDLTNISFSFSDNLADRPLLLRVDVRDNLGMTIHTLLNETPSSYGEWELVWDGDLTLGKKVPAGDYRVCVTGMDAAGNEIGVEVPLKVQYDITPPQISIISPAINAIYSYTFPLPIDFTVTDTESGVAYIVATLDGVTVSNGQIIDLKALGIGPHSLTVQAQDYAGNAATVAVSFVVIDDISPTIQLAQPPVLTNQDVTLDYVIYDEISDTADLTVTGDNGPYMADGLYTVVLTVTDEAGNTAISNEVAFTIDKTAPATTLTIGAPNYQDYITAMTSLTLQASDSLAGIAVTRFRLDDGDWQTYAAPFLLSGEGQHYVAFMSEDVAGNSEIAQTRTLVVDNSAPTSLLSADLTDSTGTVVLPETKITITAEDVGCGVAKIEYQINGGEWAPYTDPFELQQVTGLGMVAVGYRAFDRLGNQETTRVASFIVRPALTLTAGFLLSPRVLCWWNEPDAGTGMPSREEKITALALILDSAALDYKIVESPAEFVGQLNDYNVYLILGAAVQLDAIGDSLVAAQVTAGRTLISLGYENIHTAQTDDAEWMNIFGIKVAGILNGTGLLSLLPGPLAADTKSITIDGQSERITEVLSGEVWGRIALNAPGQSNGHGQGHGNQHVDTYPAIVANDYGDGKVLFIALEYSRNLATLADVLQRAITWSAPLQEFPRPGGLVGISINVKDAPMALKINVESYLPAGSDVVEVFDGGTDRESFVSWFDDLQVGVSRDYRFIVRLPNEPYPITIRVEASYLNEHTYHVSAAREIAIDYGNGVSQP